MKEKAKWCHCPVCDHRMFRYSVKSNTDGLFMAIKCSSCKEIINMILSERGIAYYEDEDKA